MKARARETIAQKAAKSEFEKYAVGYANHVAQCMTALFMCEMHDMWGCGIKTCQKRFIDLTSMLNAPPIFGRDIHDRDYIDRCKNELGIDVEKDVKIKVTIEYA
jgi:hypothetical protein|nr:MAG TPA: hypothetical protein [Caudoviricetes sp.]